MRKAISLALLSLICVQVKQEVAGGGDCGCKYGYVCKFRNECGKQFLNRTIVGDDEFTLSTKEFPSHATLIKFGMRSVCSGVIVSDYHILTKKKCLDYKNENGELKFKVGTNRDGRFSYYSGEIVEIDKICQHPRGQDLAVVRLQQRLIFDENIQPACWAPDELDDLNMGETSKCYTVGPKLYTRLPEIVDHFIRKIPTTEFDCLLNEEEPNPNYICFKSHGDTPSFLGTGGSGEPTLCLDEKTNRWTLAGLSVRSVRPIMGVHMSYALIADAILAQLTASECAPVVGYSDDD